MFYGYGDKGRLNAVTDSNGTYNYTYADNTDMIATTTHPHGLKRTRAYESKRNVVDHVENEMNDRTISKYDYTNDAAGKRTDVQRTGTAFNQSDQISYDYNSRSELTGAESTADDNYDYSYAYDNIGNRQVSSRDLNRVWSFNRDYTPDDLNQYDKIRKEFELSTRWWEWEFDWTTEPQHDKDGNMTYLPSVTGNWDLTWNAENRLVKAESTNTKFEFTYDYKGRRIRKQVYTRDDSSDLWSLTSDLRYVYNGWNPIATTKTTGNSQLTTHKTYTWGLDLSGQLQSAGGVGGLLAVSDLGSQTSGLWYPTYDANGNVSEYIDTSGSTVAHYEYSPFGRLTAAEGPMAADFNHRFSTKYQSNETGLYYYGFRYYSAELGRWLSRDPIGEHGGINLYNFLETAPVNGNDLLGLMKWRGDNKCEKQEHEGNIRWKYEYGFINATAKGSAKMIKLGEDLTEGIKRFKKLKQIIEVAGAAAKGSAKGISHALRKMSQKQLEEKAKSPHGSYQDVGMKKAKEKIKNINMENMVEMSTAGFRGVRMDVFFDWEKCKCKKGWFGNVKFEWGETHTYDYRKNYFDRKHGLVKTWPGSANSKGLKDLTEEEIRQGLKSAGKSFNEDVLEDE